MPVLAEKIGRYTRDMVRLTVVADLQEVAVRPGIGAVQRNVDGHVAKQADAVPARMGTKTLPLLVEKKLDNFDVLDLLRSVGFDLSQGIVVTMHELELPLGPWSLVVPSLEDPEKRVIVQPPAIVFFEKPRSSATWP